MKISLKVFCFLLASMVPLSATWAADMMVEMHAISAEGVGEKIGTVTIGETEYGTLFTPDLSGLSPGMHGFHVHEKASCDPGEKDGKMAAGISAGGHFDPQQTKAHKGPYADGHLGDLPPLYADPSGKVELPVLAPRIKPSEVKGHALMVHQHGDNYSDAPKPLGGGGGRVACGEVK